MIRLFSHQFGAALDMLDDAIRACPDTLWGDRSRAPEFWYVAYHALFWCDLYIHGAIEGYAPPEPFGLEELDPAGVLPSRVFTRDELRSRLADVRRRGLATIDGMSDDDAKRLCTFGWGEVTFAELLLYNTRHVQHHTGQLDLILRQVTDTAPGWVARARPEDSR